MKKVKRFATKKQGGSSVRGSGSIYYVNYGSIKRSNYWSPPKKPAPVKTYTAS